MNQDFQECFYHRNANYECSSLRNAHCTNRMLEYREGNIKYILNVKDTLELELVPF